MLKITNAILIIAVLISLLGCQEEASVAEKPVISSEKATVIKSKLPCIPATTPFIKDKTKLKQMLTKSGRITADMSTEQANLIVKNYINKKREALNNCKK